MILLLMVCLGFNDSLPDVCGGLLLDCVLIEYNINPGSLSVLDRLCFVGSHGMGALIYEPEAGQEPNILHKFLDEIAEFQEMTITNTLKIY